MSYGPARVNVATSTPPATAATLAPATTACQSRPDIAPIPRNRYGSADPSVRAPTSTPMAKPAVQPEPPGHDLHAHRIDAGEREPREEAERAGRRAGRSRRTRSPGWPSPRGRPRPGTGGGRTGHRRPRSRRAAAHRRRTRAGPPRSCSGTSRPASDQSSTSSGATAEALSQGDIARSSPTPRIARIRQRSASSSGGWAEVDIAADCNAPFMPRRAAVRMVAKGEHPRPTVPAVW